MNNYPDNVNPNDPRAPWNQDPKLIDCPDCDGIGYTYSEDDEIEGCETCGATGEIEDDGSDDEHEEEYL